MPTLLIVGIPERRQGLRRLFVQETFEQVMDKCCPITPFTSSLENRTSMLFTLMDGRQAFISAPIMYIEEDAEDDDSD